MLLTLLRRVPQVETVPETIDYCKMVQDEIITETMEVYMIDKIVVSADRTRATVVLDNKSFNLHHSDGLVMELVEEMFLNPLRRALAEDEVTEEINLLPEQLKLF